jgi:hypothetical protein
MLHEMLKADPNVRNPTQRVARDMGMQPEAVRRLVNRHRSEGDN